MIGVLALSAAVGIVGSQLRADSTQGDGRAPSVSTCTGSAAIDFACHARRYRGLVRRDGAPAALRALAADQRRNGFVRAACHQLTHRIGRAAGALRGIDALHDGQPVCASGYPHGVLQAVMGRAGARDAVKRAAAICAETRAGDGRSAEHYNCVHGMGHGFMEVFSSRVFRSLDGCAALRDRWEQDECSGGVFMENVTAIDNRARPARSLRPDQPLYPCTAVAPRFWEQCYDWQVTYALYVNDSDFRAVFGLCAAAPAGARGACYRGLGGDALQQSKFVTARPARAATIRRLCAVGPDPAARRACIAGAVRNMYRDYADGDVQARALCAALRDGGPERAACRRAEAKTRREVDRPAAVNR
jgi:hypothetical protein